MNMYEKNGYIEFFLVVCLCVFGYSAYNLWDIYSQKQQVENETKQLEKKCNQKKGQRRKESVRSGLEQT